MYLELVGLFAGAAAIGAAMGSGLMEAIGKTTVTWLSYMSWRRKIHRQYGKEAVAKMSDDQKRSLAQYRGSRPPDLTETAEAFVNSRFAPKSEAELNRAVTDLVLRAQLEALVADPHNHPEVTFGDAIAPPRIADGRPVDYKAGRARQPARLSVGYWKALTANRAAIEAVERAALPNARPALAFTPHPSLKLEYDEEAAEPLRLGSDRVERLADLTEQLAEISAMGQAASPGSALSRQCIEMITTIENQIRLLSDD